MKRQPLIARQRQQAALSCYQHKLSVMERLIENNQTERYPKLLSVSTFARWNDTELGVAPVSRTVIYSDAEDYVVLRPRLQQLLERMRQARMKQGKKKTLIDDLRKRIADLEARAQDYVNQYTCACAEASRLQQENRQLHDKLRRLTAEASKVRPLQRVPEPDK